MNFFCVLGLVLGFLLVARYFYPPERDDTDGPEKRSGMALYIDYRTGCHYLGNPFGGITPRLDQDGRHMCEPRQ